MSPSEILEEALEVMSQRESQYSSNYLNAGVIRKAFFPDGVELKTEEDFLRFAMISHVIGKISRYCINFNNGGHGDSLVDGINYSAMLKSIDDMIEEGEDVITKRIKEGS